MNIEELKERLDDAVQQQMADDAINGCYNIGRLAIAYAKRLNAAVDQLVEERDRQHEEIERLREALKGQHD